MHEPPTPKDLEAEIEKLDSRMEGMQELLSFLLETLAANIRDEGRAQLRRELQGFAEYFAAEPAAMVFHHALTAVAKPRPQLRLISGGRPPDRSPD